MRAEDDYLKVAHVMAIVCGYPPALRDELLSRLEFIDRAAIETDAIITLTTDGLSFRRSELLPTVISAFDRTSSSVVATLAGEEWTVRFAEDAKPPGVVLERNKQRLLVAQFALLTPDREARLKALETAAEQKQLSGALTDRWRAVLSERMPNDRELMEFHQDLQNTTIGRAEAVADSLQQGGLSVDILLPRDPGYYQQLIGEPAGAGTLGAYLSDCLAPFLERLVSNGQVAGLSLALLTCAQPSVSQLIEAAWNGDAYALASAFTWLSQNGDPISNVGAIELGLRRVQADQSLRQPLRELIDTLLSEIATDDLDPFILISALFVFIYGQMAMRRVLVDWPPFIRRAAALAHAAIVARQLRNVAGNGADLVEWLRGPSEPYFTLQCLIDMRTEPRWFPELASPDQWRNELMGRVLGAAASAPEAVDALGLRELLLGESPESVASRISRAEAMLPGPLEGASPAHLVLSLQTLTTIQDTLATGKIDTVSFSPLINASMWYQLPEELVEFAVTAIERADYQIPVREEVDLASCLLGLASVAAVSRSQKLREAIQIVVRVSWRLYPGAISADEGFRIGALACAAHEDATDWAARIGQFMTELAFQELSPHEAASLQSNLSVMCHIAPALWGTCGQADAALALAVGR